MTPYEHVITTPNAWTNRSIDGKAGLTHHLTPGQIAAFDTLLVRTRHKKPQEVARADFDHPEINALAADLAQIIRHGRGAVLLSGLSPDRYSAHDLQRIYWGIGTHLGTATVQSALGDRLGHVRHVKDDPVARGYRSNEELTPHTDSYPIVGLLCLQRAETGGHSRMGRLQGALLIASPQPRHRRFLPVPGRQVCIERRDFFIQFGSFFRPAGFHVLLRQLGGSRHIDRLALARLNLGEAFEDFHTPLRIVLQVGVQIAQDVKGRHLIRVLLQRVLVALGQVIGLATLLDKIQ